MSAKIDIEDIKKIYEDNGLVLLETATKGITKNYKCRNSEGYLFNYGAKHLKDHSISNHGPHVFSSKNPYSWDNVLHFMESRVDNGTALISTKLDWKNRDSVLVFKCGICGKEFKKRWTDFIRLDFKMCNHCFEVLKQKGQVPSNRLNPFVFHERCKALGLIPLFGSELTYQSKVLVQDKEGYRGLISLGSIMNRDVGFNRFHTSNPFSLDNLRLYGCLKEWDCILPNQQYGGNKSMLQVICSCGKSFEVTVGHYINGKYRCNHCRGQQSQLATMVEEALRSFGVEYVKEKRFQGCKNRSYLPFDFYIKGVGCIEVDGQHHYKNIQGRTTLEEVQHNDNIKNQYCKENGIPLLRLPYWEIEDGVNYLSRLKHFLSIED